MRLLHASRSIRPGRLRPILTALSVAAVALSAAPVAASSHVEVVVSFDAAAGELPEGVAVDKRGNVYVSLIEPVSEIRKVTPAGDQTVLTAFDVGGNGPLGLAVDAVGNVYAAVASFDPATQGVYRVRADGTATRLPGTGAIGFPNGLAFDERGNLYVTDTIEGAVWRIGRRGGSAELWIEDPLLEGTGVLGAGFPIGANGIADRSNAIVVGNTELGTLVEVPILPTGGAGEPVVIADDPALFGVDGLAVDVHGGIWAAVIAQSTIVRVVGDAITTVADAGDGINQASSIAFGASMGERKNLFAVNFGIFSPTPTPSLLRIRVGIPGAPVP